PGSSRWCRMGSVDAELVLLAVMQAHLGHVSERCWLRYAGEHLRSMLPHLPGRSGYNKRLRKLAGLLATPVRLEAAPAPGLHRGPHPPTRCAIAGGAASGGEQLGPDRLLDGAVVGGRVHPQARGPHRDHLLV